MYLAVFVVNCDEVGETMKSYNAGHLCAAAAAAAAAAASITAYVLSSSTSRKVTFLSGVTMAK